MGAFVPASHMKSLFQKLNLAEIADVDISIPYDAAARMAYDEWRQNFNKGNFDGKRYEQFKNNYEALTAANMGAKKRARDDGTGTVDLLTLNEFGDYSAEEYEALQANDSDPSSADSNIMGRAMEAVESQAEASNALGEAADALAEEEEQLAEKLGFKTVYEMEAAIDSMQGISEEGVEIESDNIAREARIRSAYMDWCKEYGKDSNEDRFKIFYDNFLTMEKFAQETGREMSLNQYADWTEGEYRAASKARAEEEAISDKAKEEALNKAAEEKNIAEAENVAKANAIEEKAASEKQSKEERNERADAAKRAMASEERKQAAEEERKQRQAAQERSAQILAEQAESAAIAAVKAEAEREALLAEKRRKNAEAAAQAVRQKERDWQERQKQVQQQRSAASIDQTEKGRIQLFSFSKMLDPRKSKRAPVKKTPSIPLTPPPAAKKKIVTKKEEAPSLFDNIFSSSKVTKLAEKSTPKLAAEEESVAKRPSFSLFPPTTKPASKSAPTPVTLTKKEPVAKRPSFTLFPPVTKPAPQQAPVPAPFSFFPTPKKTAEPASSEPASARKPPPRAPVFSLFGGSPKPAPKASPTSVATPTLAPAANKSPASSLFSPAPKQLPPPQPAAAPARKTPAFSFLGRSPQPAASRPAPAPMPNPAMKKSSAISFFSPAPKPAPKPGLAPAQKNNPSFSLFGSTKKLSPSAATNSAPAQPPAPQRATLSLFGVGVPAKKTDAQGSIRGTISLPQNRVASKTPSPQQKLEKVPVLSRWVQNPTSRTITGDISGSKNFRNGTRITTSPVRGKAKAGAVVRTGSGSQYLLQ